MSLDITNINLFPKYFLVYELPFKVILVSKYSFSNYETAEIYKQSYLKWFDIWDEPRYNICAYRKIFVPFGKRKLDKNIYQIKVTAVTSVSARNPNFAHRLIRKLLSPYLSNVKTEIIEVNTNLQTNEQKK